MTEPFDTEEPSPTVAAACASSSTRSKDLTGQILDFLSNASNETLGACIAGLGAATYLVLGRVGLVLIGVACGIAFHASWERTGEDDGFQQRAGSRRKKAVGLDVVKRLLDARNRKHPDRLEDVSATHADQVQVSPHEKLDFAHLSPESAESLGELVDAIVNNYIKSVKAEVDISQMVANGVQMVVHSSSTLGHFFSLCFSSNSDCIHPCIHIPRIEKATCRHVSYFSHQRIFHIDRVLERAVQRPDGSRFQQHANCRRHTSLSRGQP